MEKVKQIKIAKSSFAICYFMIFVACLQVLPEIFCSAAMQKQQTLLTENTVLKYRNLSYLLSVPFLYMALSSVFNKREQWQFVKVVNYIKGILWICVWFVAFVNLADLMLGKGMYFKELAIQNQKQYILVVYIIIAVLAILGMYFVYQLGYLVSQSGRNRSSVGAILYFLSHPLFWLEMIGFLVLFAGCIEGIPYVFGLFSWPLSFVSRTIQLLVISMAEAFFLYLFFLRLEGRLYKYEQKKQLKSQKQEEKTEEEDIEEENTGEQLISEKKSFFENLNKKKLIFQSVFIIFPVVLIFVEQMMVKKENSKISINDRILSNIDTMVLDGELKLLQGDLDGALVQYRNAYARAQAWTIVLDEMDDGSEEEGIAGLEELAFDHSSDIQVTYLYLMNSEDTVPLEQFVRAEANGYVWCQYLLQRYEEIGKSKLDDAQKALRQDAINICIANAAYVNEGIVPEQVKDKRKLVRKLKEYEEAGFYADMIERVANVGREGTLNQEMVDDFLDIAEENPDVFICQYLAFVMGTSYLDDEASHYERTVKVMKNYDKLFAREDVTSEQIAAEKLSVANGCMKCRDYKAALEYLEDAGKISDYDTIDMMMMQCYAKLGENEKGYQYAKNVLKKNPNDLTALYYASTESLKQGNLDDSIEYALTLAKNTELSKDNFDVEILLYQYAQFMVISDDSYWTGYVYSKYNDLTEEQWKKLEESELLTNYLHALNYTFENQDYDLALEYTNRILDVNQDFPQANYLKATILYQKEEFEEAVEYYKKSIAVFDDSANAWFGLANAYDAMEEYEMAYQCCEKVAALKPYMDHDSSWFGVSVHNENLMNSLKNYVNQ